MKRQQSMLHDLIGETSFRLKKYDSMPKMTLVYRASRLGHLNYYGQYYEDRKKVLVPLGKADSKEVVAYKRQKYLREKLKILERDKKVVDALLNSYKDYSTEEIQKGLPLAYQEPSRFYEHFPDQKPDPMSIHMPYSIIEFDTAHGHLPDSITKDERFIALKKWAAEDYKRNSYPLEDNPNIARDGTPMRSKGECMWYDNILFEGLPVRVDPEIRLKGKSGQWHTFCPDFVFKCFDGTYIYVEHFGYLDNDEYAEKKKQRIQEYLDCGIILGDNLIITSDNADHHTNELMILDALQLIMWKMFR
ncbi:MAG: hypothetical protein IJH41_07270 [Eubacterium sp.]|nr:hypothetical protein [Eubacterium sp.]